MATDKRLDTLQEEIKLLKGELKNSLASVRDYLLNQELPSAELAGLSGFYGDGEQKISMKSSMESADPVPPAAPAGEIGSEIMSDADETETEEDIPPEDEELISVERPAGEEELLSDESPATEETVESPDGLLADEEDYYPPEQYEEPPEPAARGRREDDVPPDYARAVDSGPSTPRVNLLANLITWVARAKDEIGKEQLATFLEVYGLSGHLSPELKEIILHFAEITAENPGDPGRAEVWSQAMLSLHGILTGGDAPLHPSIPAWTPTGTASAAPQKPAVEEDELIEVDRPPMKLKLTLADGRGKSKEYCIDLSQEA
jgi:hypothetical protein